MTRNTVTMVAGILAMLSVATSPARAQDRSFEWSGSMAPGRTLEVKGIVGSIRATLATGDRAEVLAVKRGDTEDLSEVAIEVVEVGDRVVVCAVYGSWNHGQDRCHPDDRGRNQERGNQRNRSIDVEVEYEVRVPAGVEFDGSMVSGGIRAEDLRSNVSASTVNGDIRISTTARAWANTVSGDMEVEMGDTGDGDMDFNTVSGDITLWLPSDFSGKVDFNSISGHFESDFDITIRRQRGRWVGSQLEGTIGGGERNLSLHTVSGDVELRRSR